MGAEDFRIGGFPPPLTPDSAGSDGNWKLFPDDIASYGYTSQAAKDSMPFITKPDETPNLSVNENHNNGYGLGDVNNNLSFGNKIRAYFNNKFGDRSGLNGQVFEPHDHEWIG